MKVSESWLREWVNPSISLEQLVSQLTMAGLEVDALIPASGDFSRVVVARVLVTTPHPQADRLTLCEVDAGDYGVLRVVCGAANVRADLRVALALPGARLPGDVHIKESKLRGELSQGMLCAATELGIEDQSSGIMELPDDAPIGVDLHDYLKLYDHTLDIDLTPNRADCFSVVGIARDVAALNRMSIRPPAFKSVPVTLDDMVNVNVSAPEACARYLGRLIRGINAHAMTPLWLKERLRRSGLRPLHPVVDVTNYVMLELGFPLHAFDAGALQGNVCVRYARENESLRLLNGQTVTLDDRVLVISDDQQSLAIAGIMGGEGCAVQTCTTDIFLESAYFNSVKIAGVARRYGLCTDASQRYERGVDPAMQQIALDYATELLLTIVGGSAGKITTVEHANYLPSATTVMFQPAKVKQLTGVVLSEEQMLSMLSLLGMVVECQSDGWRVHVPSYRVDIALDVDLVEEIIRLHGYDNILTEPTVAPMRSGSITAYEQLSVTIADFFSARHYHEVINYSFVDPRIQDMMYPDIPSMNLLNPISPELSAMRIGMWPGLLASAVYNMHRQKTAMQCFEVGVVFDLSDGRREERPCIAGLITGECHGLSWSQQPRSFDFFDLKGDVQALLSSLHCSPVEFVHEKHPALHPGQSARIVIEGRSVGWLGMLHPQIQDALDLRADVILFELSLTELSCQKNIVYQAISKYPQTRRDLSLIVDEGISAGQIEQVVRETLDTTLCLKSFDVFDVYSGASIPEGKKSLAIALTLQNEQRTLTDADINAMLDAILVKLSDRFAVALRASE